MISLLVNGTPVHGNPFQFNVYTSIKIFHIFAPGFYIIYFWSVYMCEVFVSESVTNFFNSAALENSVVVMASICACSLLIILRFIIVRASLKNLQYNFSSWVNCVDCTSHVPVDIMAPDRSLIKKVGAVVVCQFFR